MTSNKVPVFPLQLTYKFLPSKLTLQT